MSEPKMLTENCQQWLGHLVVMSITTALKGMQVPCPAAERERFTDEEYAMLKEKRGSFVTLKRDGNLRGCIGTILGYEPLDHNVWRMAQSAAFQDPRFSPLREQEWPLCSIEISVLTEPSLCTDVHAIEIGRHGLILQYGGHTGVFLPQVPVEQGWDRMQYLDHLCLKAGVSPSSWKKEGSQLFWYEAQVFPVQK